MAVTTGLMRRMTREEVAGVVAHELAHIRNRDTLLMTITATFAGAIAMLANFALFFGGKDLLELKKMVEADRLLDLGGGAQLFEAFLVPHGGVGVNRLGELLRVGFFDGDVDVELATLECLLDPRTHLRLCLGHGFRQVDVDVEVALVGGLDLHGGRRPLLAGTAVAKTGHAANHGGTGGAL